MSAGQITQTFTPTPQLWIISAYKALKVFVAIHLSLSFLFVSFIVQKTPQQFSHVVRCPTWSQIFLNELSLQDEIMTPQPHPLSELLQKHGILECGHVLTRRPAQQPA